MSAGEELEAALQRGWSFDELEVYADHLLAKNDPRGDVIAIDLSPRPDQPSWVQRRRAALGAWLGHALATRAGHLVQHGFLHELRDGMYPPELLDSPAGTFVRGFTTWGRARVAHSLAQLASKPRPWLTRLAIAYDGDVPLGDELARALIRATPRLREVTFIGRLAFAAFPHPHVQHARIDARRHAIELPDHVARTRLEVEDGAPGPRIAHDDLELLVNLVELAPDCNQLYTHGAQFDEPVPALLARLAAAQLVELAGPIVRVATPGLPLALGNRPVDLDELPGRRGWIEPDREWIQLGSLDRHGTFLRRCLAAYPICARMHDALVDYYDAWMRAGTGRVIVDAERLAQYRAAFIALLELRWLFPSTIGDASDWNLVETLADELVSSRGAYFRQYGYYDWY